MSLSLRNPLIALASIALSGSIALAQTPAPTPPPAADSNSAAPIERHAPPPPAVPDGGGRNHAARMDRGPGGPHGMMAGGDRGPGEMGGGFHIAPRGMWWKNSRVVQNLALTPDQVKRMDGIFQESRLKLIDLHATLQKQEVMLDPMLSANPPDSNKTLAQIDKIADARAELEKVNARMLLGIRGVLTPDQWTKLHDRQGRDAQAGPGPGRAMDNLVSPPLEP